MQSLIYACTTAGVGAAVAVAYFCITFLVCLRCVLSGEWQAMSDPSVMLDAVFPVHVLSGSAGCVELIDSYDEVFVPAWSVVRSSTYGFGLLTVHNSSHLQWQQYLDEGDAGIDTMWMIKSKARRQQQQHDSEHLLRVIVS